MDLQISTTGTLTQDPLLLSTGELDPSAAPHEFPEDSAMTIEQALLVRFDIFFY